MMSVPSNKVTWKIADINNIKPRKEEWPKGLHSIGYQMDITGFGINGKTVNKGEGLTPAHTEQDTNQQEVFVILSGSAEFSLDGIKQKVGPGFILALEPSVMRSAKALEDNTTMLSLGGEPGKAYKPSW